MRQVGVPLLDLAELRGYEVYLLLNGHEDGVLSGAVAGGRMAVTIRRVFEDVAAWAERRFGVEADIVTREGNGQGGARTRKCWTLDGEPVRFVVTYGGPE